MAEQERTEKNIRIKEAISETRVKRLSQGCRVFKVKIQKNKLNKAQEEYLKMVFVEAASRFFAEKHEAAKSLD